MAAALQTIATERKQLAIPHLDDFRFGIAPRPLSCGRGVEIGAGTVIPEINFTLPPIEFNAQTWPEIRSQYREMIDGVCRRAVELEVPASWSNSRLCRP